MACSLSPGPSWPNRNTQAWEFIGLYLLATWEAIYGNDGRVL